MMEDRGYGYAEQATDEPSRTLDNIGAMVEEVSVIADRLEGFLARFHGTPQSDGAKSAGLAPVPSGYSGKLDVLRGNIARADKLSREISSIG
jgi:hypothetical protein